MNNILLVSSIIAMEFSIVCFSVVNVLTYLIKTNMTLVLMLGIFACAYLLFAVVVWRLLHVAKLFGIIIVLRLVILLDLICVFTLFVYALFSYLAERLSSNPMSIYDVAIIVCLLLTAFYAVSLIIDVVTIVKRTCLKRWKERPFVLFLRCFKFDRNNKYRVILHNLSCALKDDYKVLQIGNPNNILKGLPMCDTFYLPSSNWQKIIDKYIHESKFVLLIVDKTNGVLWEMLNHTNEKEKYIYYLPQDVDFADILANELFINSLQNGNPIAGQMKRWEKEITPNTYFFFSANSFYKSSNIFVILRKYIIAVP